MLKQILKLHSLIAQLEAQGCWGMAQDLRKVLREEIEFEKKNNPMAYANAILELVAS